MDVMKESFEAHKGMQWSDYPDNDDEWYDSLMKSYDAVEDETTEDAPAVMDRKTKVSQDDIVKWASWTKPFPLPMHMVPVGDNIFEDVTDDELMEIPPHMLVHLQRTSAQGGLQIISPRQIPVTCMMSRVGEVQRELGDHVVGSVASRDDYWPTLDGSTFEHLLPDQPLPCLDREDYAVEKTRTEPLTTAGHLLKDPILNCLVKGRAVIDIQNREDVMGDGDKLAELLANAWGISRDSIMEMDAYSLGVSGPLLRHALKSDDIFSTVHAPMHLIKSVSVSCNEATRELLPADCAIDWRRMRTVCEAIYLYCASSEGIALRDVIVNPPPGDPSAPLNRDGTMAFRPSACVAWSFEAKSFCVNPVAGKVAALKTAIPDDVVKSLSKYMEVVKPVSHVLALGHRARTRSSHVVEPRHRTGESISDGYRLIARTIMVGSARGRNSARAVRNLMHDALASAPLSIRLRIARYIHIAKSEVKTHLGMAVVPDRIIDRIATKFLKVGETIRQKVASEAARRSATVEEWWQDIVAQAPDNYKAMTEGTMGWAKVALWLTFRAPTDKWEKLEKTMHYTAVRDAEVRSVAGIPLPPELGSVPRLVAGARAVVKGITSSYFGYYCAVSDVGMAIADMLQDMGQPRKADVLREACYLWILRARALRGTNVDPVACNFPSPSYNHLRVFTQPVDLLVVPAPYRAFQAYKSHVMGASVVHKSVKREIREFDGSRVSSFFGKLRQPIAPAPESLLTRYLLRPYEMEQDLEQTWGMLRHDVERAAKVFEDEVAPRLKRIADEEPTMKCDGIKLVRPDMSKRQKPDEGYSYNHLMSEMDMDLVEWIEDVLYSLPPGVYDMLNEKKFADVEEVRQEFMRLEKISESESGFGVENVV